MNIKVILTAIALATFTELQAQSFFNPQKVNGSGNEAIDHTTIDTPSCNELYNLQGQKLTTPPANGVYILNGRKVVK